MDAFLRDKLNIYEETAHESAQSILSRIENSAVLQEVHNCSYLCVCLLVILLIVTILNSGVFETRLQKSGGVAPCLSQHIHIGITKK
jgi:hypothetical protein